MAIDLFFKLNKELQQQHSYLHPNFDPKNVTAAEVRRLLLRENFTIPWGKKATLDMEFNKEIRPNRKKLIKQYKKASEHPSTKNIENAVSTRFTDH